MQIIRNEILSAKKILFEKYVKTLTEKYNARVTEFNENKKFWQFKKSIKTEQEVLGKISKSDWDNGFNDASLFFFDKIKQENELDEFLQKEGVKNG
jgi:hypothetical protein